MLAATHLLPVVIAYFTTLVMSTAGVSGAFLLLPLQISLFGFTGPAVTPTNHLFNVVAIPSGVYRYVREGRMVWPLALVIVVGTIPGVIVGSFVRIYLLNDARYFKAFVGLVLLFLGVRLIANVARGTARQGRPTGGGALAAFRVKTLRFDWHQLAYEFQDRQYRVSTPKLVLLTAVVGVVGGAYGVGGGAIIAPILVSSFGLPVYTTAGATLLGTCLTSIVAVAFFTIAGPLIGQPNIAPNWLLGFSFGLGGILGMYTGARLQKYLPSRLIIAVLGTATSILAVSYVVGFFRAQ
ncbi:MAG: sulfite exporter TauE/SafE family protein [Pseudomonadota bacterium]